MLDAQLPQTVRVSNPEITHVPHGSTPCCDSKEGCGNCMKGGMPLKKEVLSFITLFMVGVATLLAVLLISEKRQNLSLQQSEGNDTSAPATQQMKYELPKPKVISKYVELPDPKLSGSLSVEQAIYERRSKRFFSQEPVTMQELSQILWSAQGITDESGHRVAPSARNIYPYTLYVVVRNVAGLPAGLYVYDQVENRLGDLAVANAGELLAQSGVQDNSQKAPVVIVMAASFAKAQEKFPDDPKSVTFLEGGHIGQNIYLQAEALKMATVVTAGFDTVKVGSALQLDPQEYIVYLVPFGHIGEAPVEAKE